MHITHILEEEVIYCLSQKVRYASKIIDAVINGFSPNDVSIHLRIFYHSIVTFFIREKCLGFTNTSLIDILDRFIISVVYKVKTDICIFFKE